jgi:isopentenyl diphosphate isomerase/L-lactate dehydrogenase-like FMN-dependent dehydrogenase
VAQVLEIYRSEIDRVMGLLGAESLGALRRLDVLVDRGAGSAALAHHPLDTPSV